MKAARTPLYLTVISPRWEETSFNTMVPGIESSAKMVPFDYRPSVGPYSSSLAYGTVMRQFIVRRPFCGRRGPVSGQRRMKSLDALLYRWVGEADDSLAETAFRTYYSAAFPLLVRHVRHRTGWDSASAEDIAQEALIRFFERIGGGRRDAIAVVRTEAGRLTDSDPSLIPTRLIAHWAGDVTALTSLVVAFRFPGGDATPDGYCRRFVEELSTRITSLQRTGLRLLDSMPPPAARYWAGCGEDESLCPAAVPGSIEEPSGAEDATCEVVEFSRERGRSPSPGNSNAGATERPDPGNGALAQSVRTIVETLPRLRMPTNSYLFEITTSTFLDEIKRRKRKKRGGLPTDLSCVAGDDAHGECGATGHPLKAPPDDSQTDTDADCWDAQPCFSERQDHSPNVTLMLAPSVDPVMRYESEDFLRRFYEHLRVPVARAVNALETARVEGPALPERRRLETVARKFSRMVAVLSLLGEGYTQEETAQLAGLSRNQVKYIAQTVKDAYQRFTDGSTFTDRPGANREGESHVS